MYYAHSVRVPEGLYQGPISSIYSSKGSMTVLEGFSRLGLRFNFLKNPRVFFVFLCVSGALGSGFTLVLFGRSDKASAIWGLGSCSQG